MRILILPLLFITFGIYAQPKVLQSKTPVWVTQYEYSTTLSDTAQTSNGYAYLLVSDQRHVELQEHYYKYVMKVTSDKGLTPVSSINEYFDPSYQKLTFHELNIIRNGNTINKLDPNKFDVIRREEDMERAVYDKSVNAVYNMPDVRVGDIVEYSFTRKGVNPAFGDHAFGTFYLQYGSPVAKFASKFIYNQKRKIAFKAFGNTGTTAQETQQGQLKTTEWIRENAPALLADDQYPSWYNPYAYVQYTDFQSWDEVKQWAMALYKFPELNNGDLKKAIEEIDEAGTNDEWKIKECIRVAQGDIRYLSFSDGIHGYKPHSPEMVFDQKYGDCKDKSFMLSLMLNTLGIKSSPALVTTDYGHVLPDMLPYPWAFNHCIVQFTYNDSTYWIDPTMNAQVGPLKSYFFPSYEHALVINDDQGGLTPIPFGNKFSKIDIKEEYSMDEVGGYVTLKVRTTYYGDEAEDIRSYFRSNTTEQVNKDYLNFYAKDFSEISLVKDFEYTDDPATNVIVSSEEYLLKNFWTIEGDKKSASVFASLLATYLKKPETRVRAMPLAISHPRNISQTIKIYLPEEWSLADSETEIESDGFTYKRSRFYADKVFTMRYHYKTKASFINAESVADHIEKIDQVFDDNGYSIFKPLENQSQRSNTYVIVFILIAVGIYMARKRFSR